MQGILGVYHVLSLTLKATREVIAAAPNGFEAVCYSKKKWGIQILERLNTKLRVEGVVPESTSTILVGNHISYLDIPVLCSLVGPRFVAKDEVSRWPIFGKAGRAGGTIFVRRGDKASMASVRSAIAKAVLTSPSPVVIFPSGTTSMDESCPWKPGTFALAQEHGIPIIPFRIRYQPMREAAYILNDTFVPHLMNWAKLKSKRVEIEFGQLRQVTHVERDCEELRRWTSEYVGSQG